MRFPLRMVFRLTITWILSPLFPLHVEQTRMYPCMLLAWGITGLFRNLQRSWRETHLIGGWESNSLSLYISLTYLRFPPLPNTPYWSSPTRLNCDIRGVIYYALFPLGVFCECWIFWSVARHVWVVVAVPMAMMVVVHVIGIFPRKMG